MDSQKNLFILFGEWLAARQARRAATAPPHASRRLTNWLPTRGNVIFTLAMIALLIAAQSGGALPVGRAPAAPEAASTGTIAYQGRLADATGAPLTGTYNMIFRLYDAAAGGTPLWGEPWTGSNGVKVSDGLFNVMLGSLAQLPISQFTNSQSLFLGITVGTDDEMQPRVQLGSVPFAVQALTVPDGSVTTAKIANGAVTSAKLASSINVQNDLIVNGTSYLAKKASASNVQDTGPLEVGSRAMWTAGKINGTIGFPGYGIQHGQIAWVPGSGFYLIDSSIGAPSGDFGTGGA
ncbi:MAG: hypothetical protein FJ011_01575 [Chloroflexi bacterium]|nr:hypothetical protein [Chloroflexota bacterium]